MLAALVQVAIGVLGTVLVAVLNRLFPEKATCMVTQLAADTVAKQVAKVDAVAAIAKDGL
jgi:hypothetical protein